MLRRVRWRVAVGAEGDGLGAGPGEGSSVSCPNRINGKEEDHLCPN